MKHPQSRSRTTPLCAISLIALLGACTTVGPDYAPPVSSAAPQWLEPADTSAVEAAWWDSFGDPLLTSLITRAMDGAPDIAIAEARLREARANRAAVLGENLPQVSAGGSAMQNRISENGQFPAGQIPGFTTGFSLFDLGFDAGWEADFWGRRIRQAEAAEAVLGAAEAGRDAALVMLSAEIARNYLDLRLAQAEEAAASTIAETLAEQTRLMRLMANAGEVARLDAERSASAAALAEAAIPAARAMAAGAAYRIAALLGELPENITPALLAPAPLPQLPDAILTGLRSDLLQRRPDVRLAERELAAATAGVGVATADLFPRFSLLGGLGTQARSIDGLADDGSLRFSIGPTFSWPIFSGGRIRAQIAAADARAQEAAARYESAAMQALAESEGAINRWLRAREAQGSAAQALGREQEAYSLAELRFQRGTDSRIDRANARRQLTESERLALRAKADAAQAGVALFKALGGAWQAAPDG